MQFLRNYKIIGHGLVQTAIPTHDHFIYLRLSGDTGTNYVNSVDNSVKNLIYVTQGNNAGLYTSWRFEIDITQPLTAAKTKHNPLIHVHSMEFDRSGSFTSVFENGGAHKSTSPISSITIGNSFSANGSGTEPVYNGSISFMGPANPPAGDY
jgi:hypothetical protein